MPVYRVIIVDDHPLFRAALKQALVGAFKGIKLDEAGTLDQVTERLDRDRDVDLVLLDLKMPGVQGLSGLMFLRAQYPAVPIAVVSASDEPHIIRRALDLGASGFIPKSLAVDDMRRAIAAILQGGVWAPEGLGAGAVQIGTGFLRCPEAQIHPAWADALAQTHPEQTTLTRAFSGRAGRSIATAYVQAAMKPDAHVRRRSAPRRLHDCSRPGGDRRCTRSPAVPAAASPGRRGAPSRVVS